MPLPIPGMTSIEKRTNNRRRRQRKGVLARTEDGWLINWTAIKGGSRSSGLQFPPLALQLRNLIGARLGKPTDLNELDDPAQLILVEPSAVRLADVHHHIRAAGKVHTMHQLPAHRAGQIFDLLHRHRLRRLNRGRHPKHGGLLFPIRADGLQRFGVSPDTFATRTFAQIGFPNDNGFRVHPATRAGANRFRRSLFPVRFRATMRTEFGTDEHHPETGRTSNGRQTRVAMSAARGFRGSRRAAVGAIE